MRRVTMKLKYNVFLAVLVGVASLASTALAQENVKKATRSSYVAFKVGIYSPSESFNIHNLNVETTFDGNTETGVDAEIAFGHYFLPTVVLELGAGYFKAKGQFDTGSNVRNDLEFNVIPIILSGKFMIPVGSVSPYGEVGIGAYFSSLDVSNNGNSFSGNSTFGIHAGAGIDVPVSETVFVGAEGRYVWADPSFGEQPIRINDVDYSLDGFTLNGFTLTLGVGLRF
jgi:outer membrane protein W